MQRFLGQDSPRVAVAFALAGRLVKDANRPAEDVSRKYEKPIDSSGKAGMARVPFGMPQWKLFPARRHHLADRIEHHFRQQTPRIGAGIVLLIVNVPFISAFRRTVDRCSTSMMQVRIKCFRSNLC